MDSFKAQFESDLKTKLQQRATGNISEENILLRAFRYFDLDNSGSVSYSEWTKSIGKLGIIFQDIRKGHELFQSYDADHSGKLDYKEFTSMIFQGSHSASSKEPASLTTTQTQEGQRVLSKLQTALASRGARGLIGLARQFKIMDDDNSKSLEFHEFSKALRDFHIELSEHEGEALFNYIDSNRSGKVDYEEFIRAVRGPMNEFRSELVCRAFNKLDRDGSGLLELNDVRGVYSASKHPDVVSGKKTEDDILGEFLETFEKHHNVLAQNDQKVSKEEFQEYYNNVSCSIDTDEYFELMMNNAWKLNEQTKVEEETKGDERTEEGKAEEGKAEEGKTGEGETEKTLPPGVDRKFHSLRTTLAARGARGIFGIQRVFKILDDDNSKTLSFEEFSKGCKDFRMKITEQESQELFTALDRDSSGFIDFDELIRGIRGPMNEFREGLALKAFQTLDRDHNGVLNISDIRGVYSAAGHPEVRSGKKTEEEVLGEFLETFELHHSFADPTGKNQVITWEEFKEYYANVSASIDDDRYFELMMNNAWKITQETEEKNAAAQTDFSYGSKRHYERAQAPFGTTEDPTVWTTSNRAGTTQAKAGPRTPEVLLQELRGRLAARGAGYGFLGFARQFRIMDDDNSKSLDFTEFSKAMKDFRVGLSESDIKKLFEFMGGDKNGSIQYEAFVHQIRGEMNDFRKELVRRAFRLLDKNNNGVIELGDIRGVYNAAQHPDVRSGKKTEDEVLCDFLNTFESHHAQFKENTMDQNVTSEEFIEYYAHIAACIDDDRYFEAMMDKAWNFEGKNYASGWGGDFTSTAAKKSN